MARGDQGEPQEWAIVPISPNPRDDELHIPYNMFGMAGQRRPEIGQIKGTINFDARLRGLSADWDAATLIWITKGATKAIFAQPLTPSRALSLPPSDKRSIIRPHPWPATIRGQPTFVPQVNGGNYTGMKIFIDTTPAVTADTEVLIEEWWSTKEFPKELLRGQNIIPGLFWYKYPLGFRFKIKALYSDIDTQPLSGVTHINGQAVNPTQVRVPGFRFKATTPSTWKNRIQYMQRRENGHWHLIKYTYKVPWDPTTNPPAVEQITS